jgi:GxxExxY protein
MEKDELTYRIIGCAMKVHNTMGPGFQEVIYQRCLAIELARSGSAFHREKEQTVYYEKIEVGTRRADFVVEGKVIIEIKALVKLEDVHIAQAKNYTVAYDFPLGLLINFGGKSLEYKLLFNPKFYPVPNSANSVNSDSDMLPNPNPQKNGTQITP